MDHCPLRARALWHFFESAPDQLSGDGLFGALQLNETLGQKTHAPALFALGRLRAGQSDQMGLLLCIELGGFGGLGPAVDQCRLQPLPGEPLAHPSDRRAAYLQSIGDLGVGPGGGFVGSIFALVGLEQDARMGQLARRGVATSDQAFQLAAILPGQAHGVVPLPRHREASSCSLPRGRSHERRHSSYPRRNIAANQSCQDTSTSGDDEADESGGDSSSSSKPPRKSGDDEERPKKTSSKTKKPKSPEEEEELRASLAEKFNYICTEVGAKRCLEWVKSAPEMALDIETYGKLKRDGLLYTKGRISLISLHYGVESWFIDCDHVAGELVVPILEEIKDKPKYLHNSLFDIPRLYSRFGVLLDSKFHDTVLASRVARAGEWERNKFKVIQKSHGLENCLQRELGIEILKDRKLKWGGPLQEEHLEYATDDVAHLKELYEALQEVLREHGTEERYEAVSARLPDYIVAAVRGVPLDIGTL